MAALCMGTSCRDNSADEPTPPPVPQTSTVLVYMVADNNLSSFAVDDLNEMSIGMASLSDETPGRLIVYYAPPAQRPELREIMRDGTVQTLVTYTDGLSSVDEERMRSVISDVKKLAPASGYGLVLWSHGTGWLHDRGTIETSPAVAPQSFGWERPTGKKMSIESLARAIGDFKCDFIYFDCCHMATVEVAYELRHITPLIVASATELGVEGMPYDKNVSVMFERPLQLSQALTNTFHYYSDQYLNDSGPGCSISLIHTAPLDQLALLTRNIYSTFGPSSPEYKPVEYFRSIIMDTGIFDMRHHIEHLCTDTQLLAQWLATFNAVVEEHRATPYVYTLPADDFHGLGCQVLKSESEADTYNYRATSWWNDVAKYAFTTDNQ